MVIGSEGKRRRWNVKRAKGIRSEGSRNEKSGLFTKFISEIAESLEG